MTAQVLNLNDPKDLEEFLNTLKEFEFKAINMELYKSVLIEGGVEYFRYYGYDSFKITIVNLKSALIVAKDADYYVISFIASGKFKQFKIPAHTVVKYEFTHLVIEY